MFVAELDRPWLETPFLLQGFVVRDTDDVALVAEHCDHVFVDVEYHGRQVFLPRISEGPVARSGSGLRSQLRIREDFARAEVTFESASEALEKAFTAIRKGRHVNVAAVQRAVAPLIDSVFHNKDAVAALVRLKETGNYLYQHGLAMAVWAAILGRQIGFERDQLMTLVTGVSIVDVGMTRMPMEIVDKPEPLSAAETRLIRTHPLAGVELLRESGAIDPRIIEIVEMHHERMDGSGYPRGLEGRDIPLMASIAGLVDAYDAMITTRVWAPARSSFEAMQELADVRDRHYPAALVESFIQAIGMFPTGSLVELNSGEVGIVVRQNDVRRLKPQLAIVLDSRKQRLADPILVDLACADGDPGQCGLHGAGTPRWISRELASGEYGVDSEDFFV